MKAILQHKTRRRNFILIVVFVLVTITLLRVYVIPYHFPKLQNEGVKYLISILDKISISLIVSVFIAWYLFKIEVPDEISKLEIVEPNRLEELFLRARLDSNFLHFSGGAGRYTRAVTLPEMSKKSQKNNESISFKLLILNPNDLQLCEKYANYRNALKSSKNSNEWTKEFVMNEIIATICSAYIHKSLNSLLEINIFFKNTFSTMRIDLSQNVCIVTKEDKKDLAIQTPVKTFLYKTYKEEIFHLSKQCEELYLNGTVDNVRFGTIKETDIENICKHFDLQKNKPSYKVISKILNENKNPYG